MSPIEKAYEELPISIKNTAELYPEGRNILIRCLCREARRTEAEVKFWLISNKIKVKNIEDYIIKDDSD